MRRTQFHLRHLMVGIVVCALLAAGIRASDEWRGALLLFGGPVLGSWSHQATGGRGILGGAIGGGVFCLGIAIYQYYASGPTQGDLIGPTIGIPVLTFMGTAVGFVVGAVIWGLRIQIEDRDARYPWWSSTDSPEPKNVEGE